MRLVDSHLHFDTFDENGETGAILDRARAAGVQWMVAIGGSDDANEHAVRLAAAHPDCIRATVGYDRDLAATAWQGTLVEAAAREPGVVAIGETGLDYHYEPETAAGQRGLFEAMLELARRLQLPTVIHSRDAEADTLAMLEAHASAWAGDPDRLGVLHCFTGNKRFAKRLVDLGYYISFSGILTFRNAEDLRAVARALPLDRILIETDAPYLAPVPYRGKRNEPAWVGEVARTLAAARGDVSVEEAASVTADNACRLFALPGKTNEEGLSEISA